MSQMLPSRQPFSNRTRRRVGVWRRPLRGGEPSPTLPLSVHQAVLIGLEESYQRAVKRAYLD